MRKGQNQKRPVPCSIVTLDNQTPSLKPNVGISRRETPHLDDYYSFNETNQRISTAKVTHFVIPKAHMGKKLPNKLVDSNNQQRVYQSIDDSQIASPLSNTPMYEPTLSLQEYNLLQTNDQGLVSVNKAFNNIILQPKHVN